MGINSAMTNEAKSSGQNRFLSSHRIACIDDGYCREIIRIRFSALIIQFAKKTANP
jgi:hypothetical protein